MFKKITTFVVELIGKVHWKQTHPILNSDRYVIQEMLKKDYYIITTRRSNHLSTFFIGLGHFLLTGRWGFYSHVLMNLEDEVKSEDDFRLIEATGVGTHFSSFWDVFGTVDAVALLKPKCMTVDEWTAVMERSMTDLGKPYDSLFDLKNDQALSCVELIRNALKALPDYDTKFAAFEAMIKKRKNLTPSMFVECSDFEIVYKVRR